MPSRPLETPSATTGRTVFFHRKEFRLVERRQLQGKGGQTPKEQGMLGIRKEEEEG
jgi:hypothetical protein